MSEYHRRYQVERYHRNRSILIAELGGQCSMCGSEQDLEFDHVDADTKSFDIAKHFNRSLVVLRTETAKCQLLCKPCHRIKSVENRDFESPKRDVWIQALKDSVKHGTFSMRYHRKCKCEECIAFSEERNRQRRKGGT